MDVEGITADFGVHTVDGIFQLLLRQQAVARTQEFFQQQGLLAGKAHRHTVQRHLASSR